VANRHKRDTNARRFPRASVVAAPIALLVTASAVAFGVLAADPVSRDFFQAPVARAALQLSDIDERERDSVSRSGSRYAKAAETRGSKYVLKELNEFTEREAREARKARESRRRVREESRQQVREATARAVEQADTRLWTTAPLNLWSAAQDPAARLGLVESGAKVLVTGREQLGRVELALDGKARWVTAGYLADEKPTAESTDEVAGIGGACTNGTSVSGGANVVSVHQAVCAAFPEITSYGTYRAGSGDHASGRAIDIMASGSLGWAIADFVRANYAELGVSYVIYSQNIWSVDRGGEGWRGMSDRGSTTANHYDHVHVSTY